MNSPEFMNKVAIEPALSTYAPSEPLIWYAFYVSFSQAYMLAFFSTSQLLSFFQLLSPSTPPPPLPLPLPHHHSLPTPPLHAHPCQHDTQHKQQSDSTKQQIIEGGISEETTEI